MFAVGDVFTELRWSVFERRESPLRYDCVAEDTTSELELRVDEISAYERLWDRVYPGMTAGIRLSGMGLDTLASIDFAADDKVRKYWWLWGQRHAAPRDEAHGGA